jgi:hypothetical protein
MKYENGTWGRPDPPRLNDTGALVRKGTYPYALKTDTYCGQMPCETPMIPENTFNKKSPSVCITPPYGAGMAVISRDRNGNGGRGGSPDRNTSVPGNGNSLAGGVTEVRRSGTPNKWGR